MPDLGFAKGRSVFKILTVYSAYRSEMFVYANDQYYVIGGGWQNKSLSLFNGTCFCQINMDVP
jgi:hypothetical protein